MATSRGEKLERLLQYLPVVEDLTLLLNTNRSTCNASIAESLSQDTVCCIETLNAMHDLLQDTDLPGENYMEQVSIVVLQVIANLNNSKSYYEDLSEELEPVEDTRSSETVVSEISTGHN